MITLGDCCAEVNERCEAQDLPILSVSKKYGIVLQTERFKKRIASGDISRYKLLRYGDFAFDPMLLWSGSISRNTIAAKGVVSPAYTVFRVTRSDLNPSFLYRFLTHPARLASYDRISFGTNERRRKAQFTDFAKLKVPLPPIHEQERIVHLLDEVEALCNLRAQADARTGEIILAAFAESLKAGELQQITISKLLEKGWILLHKDGNHGSLYPRPEDFGDTGIPFLSAKSINDDGSLIESEIAMLNPAKAEQLRLGWIELDDILLAHNASVGKVGYYDGRFPKALIGTSLTAFRANAEHLNPLFLWGALRDSFFQHQLAQIMKQALRNQVPITAQRDLEIKVPPKPIQDVFAARLSAIWELKAAQAMSGARLDDLFRSLLHQGLQGEL